MLRVVSFNILAPSARICAPLDKIDWRTRHEAAISALQSLKADIICLQEFCFRTPGFRSFYESRLGDTFTLHALKRTRHKPEGIALLVRTKAFSSVEVLPFALEPAYCDRVCQLACLRHAATGKSLIVANTHLTVAHATNGHDIPSVRPQQMAQVLAQLQAMAKNVDDSTNCAMLLCADMNCDHLETHAPLLSDGSPSPYTAAQVFRPVTMAFQSGLQSALHTARPGCRPISHTSSYSQDGCADYIFFQSLDTLANTTAPSAAQQQQGSSPRAGGGVVGSGPTLELSDAFLFPHHVPLTTPWSPQHGWQQAAVAPLLDCSSADSAAQCEKKTAAQVCGREQEEGSPSKNPAAFYLLSDHRPLVADFRLCSTH